MTLKFTKSTDSEHKVKLASELISVTWTCGMAIGGQTASFEILTELVGEGAPIKVTGKSEKGKKLGKVSGVVRRNSFSGVFDIPEDIELGDKVFFEAKLSKNSLEGESEHIPAYPPIRVSNMKWSAQEARRGDTLTLTADIKGLPNEAEIAVVIYEYDRDGRNDRITELPAKVENEKIEVSWEYEYHEDTDEIPSQEELDRYGGNYNPPEYFFTIKAEGVEYGLEQESGLLEFKDWVEISLVDRNGSPMGGEEYVFTSADGQVHRGTLNDAGTARVQPVPPGPVVINFPNAPEGSIQAISAPDAASQDHPELRINDPILPNDDVSFTTQETDRENQITVSATIHPESLAAANNANIEWEIEDDRGSLGESPVPDISSLRGNQVTIVINIPIAPQGRNYHRLAYRVRAKVTIDGDLIESDWVTFSQDEIDMLRQQYIDMSKNSVPDRNEFIDTGASTYFTLAEGACNCGNHGYHLWSIMQNLDNVRVTMNRPLNPTSGYRCPIYNSNIPLANGQVVQGATNSRHIYGDAADIAVEDFNGDGSTNQADWQLLRQAAIAEGAWVEAWDGRMRVHMDWGH